VFGLTHGELGLLSFIVLAIVSARYWPGLGEQIAVRLFPAGKTKDTDGSP